jgi:hypothetical protein
MNTQSIRKTGELLLLETPEKTECPNAVLIRLGPQETIECMIVLRVSMVVVANHGITTIGMEKNGEEDHETLNVELR